MGRSRRPRLIVVANRGPYTAAVVRHRLVVRRSSGGLVAALEPLMRTVRGVWIASDDRPRGDGRPPPIPRGGTPYPVQLLSFGEKELANFYYGFANRVLWPICHGFVGKCRFEADFFRDYLRCNAAFSRAAVEESSRRDTVWVHDYHLALAPAQIRAQAPHLKVLLFWHIPFPPCSVFRAMPWAREILEGMLGADLIGFHTGEYVRHFLECCRIHLGLRVEEGRRIVRVGRRRVRVIECPIGADVEGFESLARRPGVLLRAHRLRKEVGAQRIILGVDRLDYTKGIPQRLLAYERFLQRYPQYRGRQVLLQVAVPSRTRVDEYRALKREVDETVGRINALYTDGGWIPIRYLYRSISRETLAVLYAAADVALITPLRDGMNLVAKEYVACQTRDDGVLVISDLAGAAEELEEALVVNPYNFEQVAEALRRAMEMTGKEKTDRMQGLRRRVAAHDIRWWLREFLRQARFPVRRTRVKAAASAGSGAPLERAGWVEAEEPGLVARPV
jgi:trehalose 6-phosphate synthase